MPAPFVLILDDYHTLNAQPIHDALTFILDHMPPQMHLVVSTRSDPPLPIARLRARDQMMELRQNDLRFTADEAVQFLSEAMRLNLASEDIATLVSRTEGWMTGLQMAALSMQGHQDAASFIKAFTGSHHFVLDYLMEEVHAQQRPEVSDSLLKTCLLDRLNAGLCDYVTRRTDSQELLRHLETANLFLIPLDRERQWFTYHSCGHAAQRAARLAVAVTPLDRRVPAGQRHEDAHRQGSPVSSLRRRASPR